MTQEVKISVSAQTDQVRKVEEATDVLGGVAAMTGARPSRWKSLPAGPALDAEVYRRVFGLSQRDIRSAIKQGGVPKFSTCRDAAAGLQCRFRSIELGYGDLILAGRFNQFLLELSANALAAKSLIRVAAGLSRPAVIARAALFAYDGWRPTIAYREPETKNRARSRRRG